MSADLLLGRLEGVKGRNGQWRARCPVHGSRGGTLAIREEPDGRLLIHCHAGCATSDVLAKVGSDWEDLFPERLSDERLPRVRKPWKSSDVIQALRFELGVAWVVLADVSAGKEISQSDRVRAGVARERCLRFMRELDHAH
jgi:putative DNA primase/helicase